MCGPADLCMLAQHLAYAYFRARPADSPSAGRARKIRSGAGDEDSSGAAVPVRDRSFNKLFGDGW